MFASICHKLQSCNISWNGIFGGLVDWNVGNCHEMERW